MKATSLVRRYARTRGPFQPEAVAQRYGLTLEVVTQALAALQTEGQLAAGEYTRGVQGQEYCDPEALRQIHRQTLTLLRHEVEPVDGATYARFLLDWQGVGGVAAPRPVGRGGEVPQALHQALRRLQGLLLPAELWEREILPSRVPAYQPAWLDQLLAAGELHWTAGPGGRLAFYRPDQVDLYAGRLASPAPEELTPEQERVLAVCQAAGADFLGGIARRAGLLPPDALQALWTLAWLGLVANDTFAPVRQVLRPGRGAKKGSAPLRGGTGRWWPTASLVAGSSVDPVEGYALLLLERYGVATREAAEADGGPAPWGEVLQRLKRMEWKGEVRQGYFIQGLTGAQFARPEVVERLRQARDRSGEPPRLLAAADPANPYGSLLPWPDGVRLARLSSTYLVLIDGRPVLGVEGFGKRLTPLVPLEGEQLRQALATLSDLLRAPATVRAVRRVEVCQFGEEPIQKSPAAEVLRSLGFEPTPRSLVYYPPC